jgi:hypothetical protein
MSGRWRDRAVGRGKTLVPGEGRERATRGEAYGGLPSATRTRRLVAVPDLRIAVLLGHPPAKSRRGGGLAEASDRSPATRFV